MLSLSLSMVIQFSASSLSSLLLPTNDDYYDSSAPINGLRLERLGPLLNCPHVVRAAATAGFGSTNYQLLAVTMVVEKAYQRKQLKGFFL